MAILGRMLINAAARMARDPRVRAKAAELLEHEIKPRAAETWRKARPKLEAARDDLKVIAKQTDPRKDPGAFAAKLKKRFIDGKKIR